MKEISNLAATTEQTDPVAHAKWTTFDQRLTWYVTEYDPVRRIAFGYGQADTNPWNCCPLEGVVEEGGQVTLWLRRDTDFEPCRMSAVAGR